MTKYIQSYDELFDESFQVEITDALAQKMLNQGGPEGDHAKSIISDTPWPHLPIKSRYRSRRHPGHQGE